MKYAISIASINIGDFHLENAQLEVTYEASEIKDMLTHILPFVKTMVDTVTEKVVPLVREIKVADREYYDAKEAERNAGEASEKVLQREHEVARDKAAQEHELLMQRLRSGKSE